MIGKDRVGNGHASEIMVRGGEMWKLRRGNRRRGSSDGGETRSGAEGNG